MKKLRMLLLPFGWLYGVITAIRNLLYNWGILRSTRISKKSILVGNLSVGGTGKTPLVEYIIQHFLDRNVNSATLSRGYGRKSNGLVHATDVSFSDEIGDEPKQFKTKFGNRIEVVVAEKRALGIEFIDASLPNTELVLLDDAFQHRAVKAGLQLIVTPYDDLFTRDFMLPAGNLREWKSGKKRADAIVVSKCPHSISEDEMMDIRNELKVDPTSVFFSSIDYLHPVGKTPFESVKNILLVTGIGNPTPFVDHWKKRANVEHMKFEDHHNFSQDDITRIHEKFDTFAQQDKVILTTEKDYMRIGHFKDVQKGVYPWYYQPIMLKMHNQELFKVLLDGYFDKI